MLRIFKSMTIAPAAEIEKKATSGPFSLIRLIFFPRYLVKKNLPTVLFNLKASWLNIFVESKPALKVTKRCHDVKFSSYVFILFLLHFFLPFYEAKRITATCSYLN